MKLNIQSRLCGDISKDVVVNALIRAMTFTGTSGGGRAIPKELLPDNEGNIDVQFIVNGIELDFETVMQSYTDNYEVALKAAARELLKDQFRKFELIQSALEDKARELFDIEIDE